MTARRGARTVRRALAAAAVATAAVVVVTGGAVPAQDACEAPYLPAYGFRGYAQPYEQTYPEDPVPEPDLSGDSLSYLDLIDREYFDTDGDGQRDHVEIELSPGKQVLVIERGDGTIRVDQADRVLGLASPYPVGDLDGDGRDEIYFLARAVEFDVEPVDRFFLLPGTTAPGSYQASDVAVEIGQSYPMWPVGQQGGGPGNDLLTGVGGPGDGGIVDGHALMAGGAGSTVPTFTNLFPLPGVPGGVLALHDGPPTIAMIDKQGDHVVVVLWDAGVTTEYRTPAGTAPNGEAVSAVEANGVRVLIFVRTDRGGSQGYTWNLTDPCEPLPAGNFPTTTTTTTPPTAAEPVETEADFTG